MQTQFLNRRINIAAGLLPPNASAVIFDCDGLLADTESLWLRAVALCAGRYGVDMTRLCGVRGVSIDGAALLLSAQAEPGRAGENSVAAVAAELTAEFDRLISEQCVAMPGAVSFVRALAHRLPVAVASNSPRLQLDRILRGIGLEELIPCSVARDEVGLAKPDPELYVEAVRRLSLVDGSVTAETAVAFEDSAPGSRAATSAGLFVVGVNSDKSIRLSCHERYLSLTDETLTRWAASVGRAEQATPVELVRIICRYDSGTRTAHFSCQVPNGQQATIEIYRQEHCRWNEKPTACPVTGENLHPGASDAMLDLAELSPGTYRYFLLTDGELPEWNGRTGEIVVEASTSVATPPTEPQPPACPDSAVEVMTWNLWFGGCHANDGLHKQLGYLAEHPHHIVALQECFSLSGSRLADALGWNIAQQGDDTAILSVYPLTAHETTTDPFATCATVHLPSGPVTVWSVHLWHSDYGPYTGNNPEIPVGFTLASRGERLRTSQLARVLVEQRRLEHEGVVSSGSPVVVAGDFNVPSHLDWRERRCGDGVEWPISKMLELAGFTDTFREVNPTAAGHTWSPILAAHEEVRDRIDFVYSRGAEPVQAHIVAADPDLSLGGPEVLRIGHASGFMGNHLDNMWPTDHAAVVTHLQMPQLMS